MGIWRRAKKVNVRQVDKSRVKGGKYVVNASFVTSCIQNNILKPTKFVLDAEVFDIRHRDVILGLSWLQENGFSVDIPNSRLINSSSNMVIPCTT